MQVEGIYTAEPSIEAKAKALKLKQEMAAAAAEEQKCLRGMPGFDLVETPKRLERQIRAEVEARVPEKVWKPKTIRTFEKPEIYDRTVTPSSIAGLGEAASVARFRGAMANLEYNQNKLRRLADEPMTTGGGATLPPTMGNLGRWLDQPRQRERYETQQLVQRLTQKMPTLDYLSWADRGMPRPETYTKENLTDYAPRIEQLANYPGRPTKEMKREAREILKSTQAKGISGSVGNLGNYTPYTSAVESGDEALANERMRQFYMLDSVVHGKQNAISHGFMDGLGILPLEKAWMNVIGGPEGSKGFQNVEAGMQKAAEMYPVLNQMAYFNGKTVQLAVLRKLIGSGVTALGGSGPIARVIQGMVTFGGSEAIQNLGDFVAGKITPEQYWTSVEHGVRSGGALTGLMEMLPAARRDIQEWFSQRKAGKGGGTALVPASSAPEPVGIEEALPMPEEDYYEAFERGFNYDEDEFIDPLDTVKEPDILIGRSVGAKAANYDVMDLKTGKVYHFVEGTHIQNVETFAGKKTKVVYRDAWKFADKYGGNVADWQHTKGFGWIATEEGERYVEVHWSQCAGVGKHDFFIKEWLD